MNLHDEFEHYYINMGRNGIDPIGYITDAECNHVCTARSNEIADLIVESLNRDADNTDAATGFNVDACAHALFHSTPDEPETAFDAHDRIAKILRKYMVLP